MAYTETELFKHTKVELKDICAELDAPITGGMNKAELVDVILKFADTSLVVQDELEDQPKIELDDKDLQRVVDLAVEDEEKLKVFFSTDTHRGCIG